MSRISALLALVGLIFALAPPVHAFDAGDLNQDGVVDQKDMAILYQAWRDFRAGTAVASLPGSEPRADINADGVIDHKDFGLFLDSWMGTYKPSITTTDFLVFNVGDKRYWVDSDGIFQWRDSLLALTGFADGVDEQHLPVLEVDEVHDQWRMTGGHILATGIYLGGQGYTYAEPMQLPDKLVQGVAAMVESDVMQGTTNEGHLSLTLTLLDIDQTVATTAHTYPGCAKVEVVRHGTINSVAYDDDSIYWLAPAMGWVQRDRNPASPGTNMARLQYIKVGTTEYGTIPTASVANLYPLTAGNLLIVMNGSTVDGQKCISTVKSLAGVTVAFQATLGLPVGDSGEYLKQSSGCMSGIAGWKNSGDVNDYALSPMVNFGSTFTLGTSIMSSGAVKYNGNNNYATYEAVICPTAIDQTVVATGTTFQHCAVLDWHLSATVTGFDLLHGEDTRLWFAPGVGIVQVQSLDNLGNTVGDRSPAVYVRVGSTTYGTQPTIDAGAAMKLAQGNAWGYADSTSNGSWDTVTIEAPETISGVSASSVTEIRGDGGSQTFDRIQSDYWRTTASNLSFCGHRADPDDDGPTGIGMRKYTGASTMDVARTLAMGDEVSSAWVNLYDSRQPSLVIGQMRVTMLLASGMSMDTPAGTFSNCQVVEELLEIATTSGGMVNLITRVVDPTAGVIAYQSADSTSAGTLWKLVWGRVGANTWGGVGGLNIDTSFPLVQGNTWQLGIDTDYQTWLVEAAQTMNGFTGTVPVSMTPNPPATSSGSTGTAMPRRGGRSGWITGRMLLMGPISRPSASRCRSRARRGLLAMWSGRRRRCRCRPRGRPIPARWSSRRRSST